MKSKLLTFIIIITVMLSLLAIPAMASTTVVDISRPEGTEVVTKEVFSIFGTCIYDETTISFEYQDRDTGEFKPLETTDGYSTFKVGSGKMFGKDVKLKYTGDNIIRITAYTKATQNDKQEDTYTVTYAQEDKKENWFDKVIDLITGNDKKE